MSLKRKHRATEGFSMASMTDVIFLLLIFFLVASTVIIPNTIKVSLPRAQQQPGLDEPTTARVTVTAAGDIYLGIGHMSDSLVTMEQLEAHLTTFAEEHPAGYLAVHADEEISYRIVMDVIGRAAKAGLKVVLATKVTH